MEFEEADPGRGCLYGRLSFPRGPSGRPYTVINMAMTVDGKVTVGNPGFLLTGSPGDRLGMDELRAAADAVLIGAGTLRHENPVLRVKSSELRSWRRDQAKPEDPLYLVVSGSGDLPLDARFFTEAKGMVVTRTGLPKERLQPLQARARVLTCGHEAVDLPAAFMRLREELGVEALLVEGGPTLTFEVIRLGLADELFVTLSPLLKGGSDTPTLLEGEGFPYPEVRRPRLLSVKHHASELYLRYQLGAG